jgi:2',3'-cyclic-nucleotide 2'-phosphodiesterase/3'-nucleotidase
MSEHPGLQSINPTAHLRILSTTDVHMHMTGWNARQGHMAAGVGLDQLALTIRAARQTAPGATLLLDNGDVLQGTPEGDTCASPDTTVQHPWPAIATALDYDAIGLGNHDFDYGIPFLEGIIAQLQAPVLCSSLAEGHIDGVRPHVILTRRLQCDDGADRSVSIGVLSVLPPQTVIWNHRHLKGRIMFHSGVLAARQAVAALQAQGADLIIALSHSGLSTDTDPGAENVSALIAAEVPGIDAMIMGHTHRRFPDPAFPDPAHRVGDLADECSGTVAGVPAVMPGYAAQFLGVIDLDLEYRDTGWRVTQHAAALFQAPPGDTDPAVTALAAPAIAATRGLMERPLTTTGHDIHSYFNALQSGTEADLVARAMMHVIADRIAGTDLATLPLIASVSSSAAGGHGGVTNYINIPKGILRARHAAMICPYQNDIWAAVLTGDMLRNWAERSAAYFSPTREGPSPLANPDAPFFNFESLIGFEAEIDPFASPRYSVSGALLDPTTSRIRSLRHNGAEIMPEAEFLVAMTSYRGAGAASFPGLDTSRHILCTNDDLAEALSTVLQLAPLGDAPVPSAWRFVRDLGAQAVIETSPHAHDYLDQIAQFDPQPLGLTDAGFLQIRVRL